jgi:ribosomal protein S18 acetylase RimI-like enzyme
MVYRPVVTVRAASAADAGLLAALSGQLGYPSSAEIVRERLGRILQEDNRIIYVAEVENGHIAGWIEVYARELLIVEWRAEIEGLIVDESYRGCGIGRHLVDRAETWAREKACKTIYVRSNVIREKAHAFYEDLGFEVIKSQLSLLKTL